ncbi:MAG: DinB family protein [Chitinophagaceae bacterium]
MNTEIQSIISNLQAVLNGQPWYGRSMYEILEEIDSAQVYERPNNNHSLIDLLYHMLTWAEFVRQRIAKEKVADMAAFEALDWRPIDPAIHTWQIGLKALKKTHKQIVDLLQTKEDTFLEEKCDYREYNFRFLLNGLIQHNIYHLGQIAYLHKLQISE